MSNKRVSELVELPAANLKPDDLFLVTDTAVNVLESKKIKASSIKNYVTNFGSLTGSITYAQFSATASYIDPSTIGEVKSASYARTSSWAEKAIWAGSSATASYVKWEDIDGAITSSGYSDTSSYLLYQGFPNGQIELSNTASYVEWAQTSSYIFYIPGVDNGRVTNSDTASYWEFNGTASYLNYVSGTVNGTASAAMTLLTDEITSSFLLLKPGRVNGTASYAMIAETCLSGGYSDTSSYLLYQGFPNGTASYAMKAYQSRFSDITTFAYDALSSSYAMTASVAESSSYGFSSSYALTASYVGGVVDVASTVIDPNIYKLWGPFNSKEQIYGTHTYGLATISNFIINTPTIAGSKIIVTAMCDVQTPITSEDTLDEIQLYIMDRSISPVDEDKIDFARTTNYINLQTAVSGAASISGYTKHTITLSGAAYGVSGSAYAFAVKCPYSTTLDVNRYGIPEVPLDENRYRGVVFYIYTPSDVILTRTFPPP